MDLTPIFIWWLILLIVGLIGWPMAFSLFRHLPDRGFTFARTVGLLAASYILWLGATFRLLQNNTGGIVTAMLLVLVVGLIWRRQQVGAGQSAPLLAWLKREWRYVLTVELLFSLAFVAWAIFRAYNPNIETAGGEKWMEIAFINSILRSDYFPPQDPWLAGFGISYYYFGYVMMAGLTQLSGLVSTVAFNLYAPTLFALTLIGAFGIIANLVTLHVGQVGNLSYKIERGNNLPSLKLPAMMVGLLAALFVAIMGNLIGLLEVLHKRGLLPAQFWIWLDIRDLKIPPAGLSESWIPDRFIWWWRGSRVLTDYDLAGREQEVIDEFPFFSFLLSDVHPHVLALPFVLLAVALALNLLFNPAEPEAERGAAPASTMLDNLQRILVDGWRFLLKATGGRLGLLLYAIAIGGLSFLNTWDFPIYLGVMGLTLLVWLNQHRPPYSNEQSVWLSGLAGIGILAAVGILLYLPFYATFQSQARGLLPNLWNPTRLPQFFVFFGPFLVAIITLLLVLALKDGGWRRQAGWTIPLTILGPVLALMIVLSGILFSPAGRSHIEGVISSPAVQAAIGGATISALMSESLWRRLANPWTFLLLGALLGWAAAQLIGLAQPHAGRDEPPRRSWLVEKFVLILLIIGLGLPLAVEFIYLRDNFGIRMNTIFKFYFQAWVLMALASAFAVYYVSKALNRVLAFAWQGVMLLLVLGAMIYPVLAIANKTNNFRDDPILDGIAWISWQRPDDYAGIQWLRQHAADGDVVLEAPGSNYAAYQYTGRVSAMTGLPTLLGWGGHQSQWRGNYDEPARREPEIDLIYNTSDPGQAQALLDKYHVTYVYVGPLERERYSPQGLNKFERLLPVAFQQGDVVIYQRLGTLSARK